MVFLRKYGVASTIDFPMIKRGVVDFAVSADWTPAAGDCKISKDEGADANSANLPAAPTSTTGKWKLALTATEMQAARIAITIIDAATKAVEDQFLIIETYGNASAQYTGDIDNLDAAVSTRSSHTAADVWAVATRTLSAAGVLAIWDQLLSGLVAAGSIGKKLADWVLGSDSKVILSNNAHTGTVIPTITAVTNDVGITQAGADKVWGSATRTLTSFGTLAADIWAYSSRTLTTLGSSLVAEIWNALTLGMTTAGSIGKRIADNLDATVSSRSTLTAADVWASATRTLTSFGTLVSDIWSYATRTLTGFGTLVSDIWSHDLSATDEDVITGRKGASVLMAIFKRFYYKVTQSGTQQIVYKADNTTAFGTMTTTEGPPQEKGKAA